jgi:hypothetical protein
MSEIRYVPASARQQPPRYRDPHLPPSEDVDTTGEGVGWIIFGGIMMVLTGAFQATMGLVALLDEEAFMAARDLPAGNYSSWGWTHLILGSLAVVTGVGLFAAWMWARVVGIALAMLSAVVHVGTVLANPAWGIAIITFDVIIVFTLAVHGDALRDLYDDRADRRAERLRTSPAG